MPIYLRSRPRITDDAGKRRSSRKERRAFRGARVVPSRRERHSLGGCAMLSKRISFLCSIATIVRFLTIPIPSTVLVAVCRRWLRCHQSLHVVTTVITADYILVRNFLLQWLDAVRRHFVSHLRTKYAHRFFNKRFDTFCMISDMSLLLSSGDITRC